MKKVIFLISIFSILAFISSFSFSSDSATQGLQDSTKCDKSNCTMGSDKCKTNCEMGKSQGENGCKMNSEECKKKMEECKKNCQQGNSQGENGCKMDSEKCKMNGEKGKMDDSKCKMNGESKCKKDNTSGGMSSKNMDSLKVCPVSGETIDGAEGAPVTYTYLAKEYTFCCEGCVKKFKAEPMNYIKEELTCPVMGEAASKDVHTVVNGVKYYFCCSGCISKFEKNPDKYLKK